MPQYVTGQGVCCTDFSSLTIRPYEACTTWHSAHAQLADSCAVDMGSDAGHMGDEGTGSGGGGCKMSAKHRRHQSSLPFPPPYPQPHFTAPTPTPTSLVPPTPRLLLVSTTGFVLHPLNGHCSSVGLVGLARRRVWVVCELVCRVVLCTQLLPLSAAEPWLTRSLTLTWIECVWPLRWQQSEN